MRRPRTTAVFTGCLTLAATAAPAALGAQSSFEGTIAFLMAGAEGAKPDTMIQTTKGKNIRLEGMGGGHMAVIFDGDGHRMLMVQPSDKKYVVMTEADMQQMHAMTEALRKQYGKQPADDDTQVQFSKTGRTEKVAGARCEVWHAVTAEDGKKKEGEACIADGVGFVGLSTLTSNPMLGWGGRQSNMMEAYRKIVGPNKGVLKIVEVKDGQPRTMMEAVAINRTPVPAAAFQPPAGYTEVKLADQMTKLQQGMQKKGAKPSTPQ